MRPSLVAVGLALVACKTPPVGDAPILLFDGDGTSRNDVAAVEQVLRDGGLAWARVDSAQLNEMSDAQLRAHRLLIVPGGNFVDIAAHLTPAATAKVRAAVRDGMAYLGLCAGAFLAGKLPYNGFDLTGVQFGFYSAEACGVRKAAVA